MSLANHITPVYHEEMGWSVISETHKDGFTLYTIGNNPKRYMASNNAEFSGKIPDLEPPVPSGDIRSMRAGDTVFFSHIIDGHHGEKRFIVKPGVFGERIENEDGLKTKYVSISHGDSIKNVNILHVAKVCRFV